jgi:hypothetical protein
VFLAGVLALMSLTVASAKSFDFTLPQPATAGKTQIPAGRISLKLQGSIAVFTELKTGKSFTAPVKVGNTEKKYEQTIVEASGTGEVKRIDAINLGGTATKLEFIDQQSAN